MSELDIGRFRLILSVEDLQTSIDFYTKLGFVRHEKESWLENFAILKYDDLTLDLMQGIIPQDSMLHFVVDEQDRVAEVVEQLKERDVLMQPAGPQNRQAFIEDPDGNAIYISIP